MSVEVNATFAESNQFGATFTESDGFGADFGSTVNVNTVLPSDDMPLMDGEAQAGMSRKFSRSDHRHPHDSEKMDYMSAISNMELEAMLT